MKLTEQQKNCPYCHESTAILNTIPENKHPSLLSHLHHHIILFHSAYSDEDKFFIIVPNYGDGGRTLVKFNYCPMCGRKLG